MRFDRIAVLLMTAGFMFVAAAPPAGAQGRVVKRAAKEAAKDSAGDAAKDAAADAAKGAAKKAVAPDAVDLNAASTEQLMKLEFDEATQQKIVAGRPYSGLDDPKLKEIIPDDVLTRLEGKITVKPAGK